METVYYWSKCLNQFAINNPILVLIITFILIFTYLLLHKNIKSSKHIRIKSICFIIILAFLLMLISTSPKNDVESFNNVFFTFNYEGKIDNIVDYVESIENNNEINERKIKVIYNKSKTFEPDQINEFRKIIDIEKEYSFYGCLYDDEGYVNRIEICLSDFESWLSSFVDHISNRSGTQKGTIIKYDIITQLIANVNEYQNEPEKVPSVAYYTDESIDGTDQNQAYDKETHYYNDKNDKDEYLEFLKKLHQDLDENHQYFISLTYDDKTGLLTGITIYYNKNKKL